MGVLGRSLAILTIAAMLAPGVRWGAIRAGGEACACPPTACRCPGHHHALGHAAMCDMANGGQCGLDSHHDFLNSLLSSPLFVPTEEQRLPDARTLWGSNDAPFRPNLLPSHARPLDQPPRLAI